MKSIFVIAAIVFLAEAGCMLRSAALVTQHGKLAVFLGTMVGTAIAAVIGVYFGEWADKALPHGMVHWIAGLVLAAVGAWVIVEHYIGGSH